MKFFIKKKYIIFFLSIILTIESNALEKDSRIQYTSENISNYFLGIVSASKDHNEKVLKHLNKIKSIKEKHSQFNIEYLRTLVLLEKFKQASDFSKRIWKEEEFFFEADLLLGLKYFKDKDYIKAEKHFERLNEITRYNLVFDDFIGNVLIAWIRASQGNEKESFEFIERVPKYYTQLKRTQDVFLKCYFDSKATKESFERLINDEEYNFSRYNFFLINYLLSTGRSTEAKKILKKSREKYNSNLLLKQTEFFINNDESKKIKNFFNCKKPEDSLAEFFYVIANLYSSEKDYQLSNFYLKISFFLNNKFLTNKALLAENFFYQKKYEPAIEIYHSLKPIGSIYSWHASKNIAQILINTKGKKYSINNLETEFNLLPKPNFENYAELANFYKENEYYKESIKYYSLALKVISQDHSLIPKILYRRGSSYERLGDWENAEKDLLDSLKILPNQPHVLNYLGYSWIDKGINLDKGLEMIKKAVSLTENDGYIIDSLGWAYYAKENYVEAELHLQRAVELLPLDPIINDHYADTLWMLNKSVQARYFWKNILSLDSSEQKLKDAVNEKLIFGIDKKL